MIQCLRLTVLGCSHAAREAAAEHLSTNPSVTQMNGAPQWPLVCAGTHVESPQTGSSSTFGLGDDDEVMLDFSYGSANWVMRDFC